MPFVLQSVCNNQLHEKERLIAELRRGWNETKQVHEAALQRTYQHKAQLWAERDERLQDIQQMHELRVNDLHSNLQQQQVSSLVVVGASVLLVALLLVVFCQLLSSQTKEKRRLEAQNLQYAQDIQRKIEQQRQQYESIIEEKMGRIEQLEREKAEQRRAEATTESTTTPTVPQAYTNPQQQQLPLVYAFPGMPSITCGTTGATSSPVLLKS